MSRYSPDEVTGYVAKAKNATQNALFGVKRAYLLAVEIWAEIRPRSPIDYAWRDGHLRHLPLAYCLLESA